MNLIVTCPRHFEEETLDEIKDIFEKIECKEPEITITNLSGILTVKTEENPIIIVKNIVKMVDEEPWLVRYSQRIIPIQKSCISEIEEIVNNVGEIYSTIKEDDVYRITVEKRHSELSSKKIITEIANKIPNKVSLENPDWIVLVEILGGKTGISVINPNDIISIEKMKRSFSE